MNEDNVIFYPLAVLINAGIRIDEIFKNKKVERYPEGFLLITEFIEKTLSIIISFKFASLRINHKQISREEGTKMYNYFDQLSFIQKNKLSYYLGLIDKETFNELEDFRNKRNLYIHKFIFVPKDANIMDVYELSNKIIPKLTKILIQYYSNFFSNK